MFKITAKPIDVQKVIDAASCLGAGALDVFIGTVRNNAYGKNVLWLEYEAYEAKAVADFKKIVDDAVHRWPVLGCAMCHRIGTLKPGEVAFVVAVSSAHRADAFAATQFTIFNRKLRSGRKKFSKMVKPGFQQGRSPGCSLTIDSLL